MAGSSTARPQISRYQSHEDFIQSLVPCLDRRLLSGTRADDPQRAIRQFAGGTAIDERSHVDANGVLRWQDTGCRKPIFYNCWGKRLVRRAAVRDARQILK